MIGTILNVLSILTGGVVGMARSRVLPLALESYLKILLAVFTVFYGLRLTWMSLGGSPFQIAKQCLILIVALTLGNLVGRLLRLQKMSNRIGQNAQRRMVSGQSGNESRASAAFKTASVLFCLPPLGLVGALADGLDGYFYPLVIKAIMDGLATLGLVMMLGPGVMLSVIPVLAVQGTLTLLGAQWLQPTLASHGLLDSVNCVAGVIFFCVALIMLGLKKVELANYLPSLVAAPALTWLLR